MEKALNEAVAVSAVESDLNEPKFFQEAWWHQDEKIREEMATGHQTRNQGHDQKRVWQQVKKGNPKKEKDCEK